MKAASVMDRVGRVAAYAQAWGQITTEECRLLLEDVGDVTLVYSLATPLLARRREARIAGERAEEEHD